MSLKGLALVPIDDSIQRTIPALPFVTEIFHPLPHREFPFSSDVIRI